VRLAALRADLALGPPPRAATELALDDHRGWARFDDFLRELLARLDLSWSGYRRPRRGLRGRLVARMAELRLQDYDEYLDHVRAHPEEGGWLAEILAITISRFFRDREDWVELAAVAFGELAALGRTVRAASLGCASGEEPYTLRILWMERQPAVPLAILAADVRADVLARATEGVYTGTSVHSMPSELLAQWFALRPGATYQLDRRISRAVRFVRLDLLRDPLPGPFDLILCRNVAFTYFGDARRREAASRLGAALAPGGFLMIGGGERLPAGTWGLGRAGRCLYRKGIVE
jgi:chemotaxis methyl-accepting protein methylase